MDLLNQRSISALPVSIGSSLAFETVLMPKLPPYDPARVAPERVNIMNYDEIWINLQTLYRNLVGALPTQLKPMVAQADIKGALYQEMEILQSAIAEESQQQCRARFYYPTYSRLINNPLLPKQVRFRVPTTDNQKSYHELLVHVYQQMVREQQYDLQVIGGRVRPQKPTKALIFTHTPYDLLSYPAFKKLELLESHTGHIKPRSQWYTKYYPVGEHKIDMLPFTRPLLLIFGDHALIKPMEYNYRKLIIDIAIKRNWTPLTTDSKILYDVDLDIKERYLVELFRKLA